MVVSEHHLQNARWGLWELCVLHATHQLSYWHPNLENFSFEELEAETSRSLCCLGRLIQLFGHDPNLGTTALSCVMNLHIWSGINTGLHPRLRCKCFESAAPLGMNYTHSLAAYGSKRNHCWGLMTAPSVMSCFSPDLPRGVPSGARQPCFAGNLSWVWMVSPNIHHATASRDKCFPDEQRCCALCSVHAWRKKCLVKFAIKMPVFLTKKRPCLSDVSGVYYFEGTRFWTCCIYEWSPSSDVVV